MKIAITSLLNIHNWDISQQNNIGGIAGVIRSILPFINEHEILLVGFTDHREELLKEFAVSERVSVYAFFYRGKSAIIPERLLGLMYGFRLLFLKRRVDVVYNHVAEIGFWFRLSQIPYVYHMHGHLNALVFSKYRLFRNTFFQHLWAKSQNVTINGAAYIVAIDDETYKQASMIKDKNKIALLPNFVDTEKFFPENVNRTDIFGFNDNKKVLLFVGRIEEVKGLELFVESIVELNRIDSMRWRGVIVGDGQYLEKLKQFVFYCNAQHFITFMNSVYNPDRLRKIYNAADLLSITSYYEGVPITLLESIACGTPVISVSVGGIPSVLRENVNGMLVTSRNKEEFAGCAAKVFAKKLNRELVSKTLPLSAMAASTELNRILSYIKE